MGSRWIYLVMGISLFLVGGIRMFFAGTQTPRTGFQGRLLGPSRSPAGDFRRALGIWVFGAAAIIGSATSSLDLGERIMAAGGLVAMVAFWTASSLDKRP